MRIVGIDWGQERHRVVIMDERGQILDREWIEHQSYSLGYLDQVLTGTCPADQVYVAIELHDSLLLDRLIRLGVRVYGLNPKSAERARERFAPAGIKDDERDAWSMAEFVRTSHQHLRHIRPDSPVTMALQEWVSLREDLTQERTVHLQQLGAHLARWNPHILKLTDNLNQKWVLDLLETHSTADSFAIGHRRMMKWTQGRHLRLVSRHRIADAATAPSPTVAPVRNAAHAAEVRYHVRSIRALNEQLAEVDKALEELIAQHPDANIFQSLPRAGTWTVAAMLAGFGEDRDRWRDHEELAARWGTAPITIKSGKYHSVRRRQACDPTLHQAWVWFAFNTIQVEGCWARDEYQARRQAGSAHYTTLRVIANHWVKIAMRCWKDRQSYDEAIHREKREKRMRPRVDK
jgi:transposase